MTDPFRDPGCACATTSDLMSAELEGRPRAPTCELHEAQAIREWNAQQARRAEADHRALRDHARAELDRIVDGPAPAEDDAACGCNGVSYLTSALAGTDVPPCAVHRPAATALPLGSDALTSHIAGMVGGTIDNGPPEAA